MFEWNEEYHRPFFPSLAENKAKMIEKQAKEAQKAKEIEEIKNRKTYGELPDGCCI